MFVEISHAAEMSTSLTTSAVLFALLSITEPTHPLFLFPATTMHYLFTGNSINHFNVTGMWWKEGNMPPYVRDIWPESITVELMDAENHKKAIIKARRLVQCILMKRGWCVRAQTRCIAGWMGRELEFMTACFVFIVKQGGAFLLQF